MYVKAVDTCPFLFDSVSDRYKSHKMFDKAISNDSFTLKYCINKSKTKKIFDKTVDDFFTSIKLWFWLVCYK